MQKDNKHRRSRGDLSRLEEGFFRALCRSWPTIQTFSLICTTTEMRVLRQMYDVICPISSRCENPSFSLSLSLSFSRFSAPSTYEDRHKRSHITRYPGRTYIINRWRMISGALQNNSLARTWHSYPDRLRAKWTVRRICSTISEQFARLYACYEMYIAPESLSNIAKRYCKNKYNDLSLVSDIFP